MSYGQQQADSESSQGLMRPQREWFSNRAPGAFDEFSRYARDARLDPGGLEYQPVVDKLLPVGRYGLPVGATEGTYQLGRDLFNQTSGARASRGFGSPENLEAVVGDATRMASGQLIPLSTQFAMQRAQMAPALRSAAFGYGRSPMDAIMSFLSNTGNATSSSSGFGFDISALSPAKGASGQTINIGGH